jgi:hypothetical protein
MDRGGTVQLLRSLRGTEMPDPSALILPMKGMERRPLTTTWNLPSGLARDNQWPITWNAWIPRATCNNSAASRRVGHTCRGRHAIILPLPGACVRDYPQDRSSFEEIIFYLNEGNFSNKSAYSSLKVVRIRWSANKTLLEKALLA